VDCDARLFRDTIDGSLSDVHGREIYRPGREKQSRILPKSRPENHRLREYLADEGFSLPHMLVRGRRHERLSAGVRSAQLLQQLRLQSGGKKPSPG